MNAYNPLTATHRLEESGLSRKQAEAIASEINTSAEDLVTKDYFREQLDAALARNTIRMGVLTSGIVAVATAVLGLLISIK
jgi:hypothetical protein